MSHCLYYWLTNKQLLLMEWLIQMTHGTRFLMQMLQEHFPQDHLLSRVLILLLAVCFITNFPLFWCNQRIGVKSSLEMTSCDKDCSVCPSSCLHNTNTVIYELHFDIYSCVHVVLYRSMPWTIASHCISMTDMNQQDSGLDADDILMSLSHHSSPLVGQ